ncbi:hypothetical protein J4460_02845 [Candidatus Woesearchaeota archaeon]|nr:MAG: 50S ribosomal protein L37, large subunit ribosomal protein L37Ae [archaeon GW2011_AR4]MBS3129585.1 hypothetical protein [Candidatus Woesearchaeota archaeon]HIH38221.1 hypothetical protein [Candidatus Woesearchaeota archaeon]HIH49698.1 hypothetical protein [Candidatus Woesearchaeota archaeon]HIJ03192.1 hypothetical protein [Candidatus Woesearchaeota archaeon]
MVKKVAYGSVRRFGARYGRRTRLRFGQIESEQRKLHKCPYCLADKVKRQALGIWECQRCKKVFTGKAYTINKKLKFDTSSADTAPEEKVINEDFSDEEEQDADEEAQKG